MIRWALIVLMAAGLKALLDAEVRPVKTMPVPVTLH